jgi:hypothetical protein
MLSPAECQRIDTTLLPTLERHHLRLLAHALRTLQTIAGRSEGPPPSRPEIDQWALSQPAIRDDPLFARSFVEQMLNAARQLEAIAAQSGPESEGADAEGRPLSLDLDDLVAWARRQAEQRIAATPLSRPSPGATPPPE